MWLAQGEPGPASWCADQTRQRVAWTTGFVVRVSSVAINLIKVYGFLVLKGKDADRTRGGLCEGVSRVARGRQPGRTHPGKTRRDVCATREAVSHRGRVQGIGKREQVGLPACKGARPCALGRMPSAPAAGAGAGRLCSAVMFLNARGFEAGPAHGPAGLGRMPFAPTGGRSARRYAARVNGVEDPARPCLYGTHYYS